MRIRRLAFVLAGLVVAVAVLWLVAALVLVPWLAPARLEALLEEQLGVEARVADIRLDPLALALRVRGLRLGAENEPVATLEEALVDLALRPLLSGDVVVEAFELQEPDVLVLVGPDGGVSIAGIALGGDAPPVDEAEPAPPAPEEPAPPREMLVQALAIRDGRLRVADRLREPFAEYRAAPIDLRVSGLDLTDLLSGRSEATDPSPVELEIGLAPAALSLEGQVDLAPVRVDLQVVLRDFDLAGLQPYVQRTTRMEVAGGTLNVTARVAVTPAEDGSLEPRIEADVGIESLDLRERGGESPLVAWKRLALSDVRFGDEPNVLRIGRVEIEGPSADVVIDGSGELNLARLTAVDAPATVEEAASEEADSLSVRIGPIQLAGGKLRFTDRRVAPAYTAEIEQLRASLDGFTTDPRGRSKVSLGGKLDGYADLAVRGDLAPLTPRSFLDLAASVQRLELSPFTPYAGRYVGKEIDGGRGSLDVRLEIQDAEVRGSNQLVVENLDFGKAVDSDEATRLPVPAAAALLADSKGQIHVDLPVRGNLDDPSFSYTGTLLRTFRTLILRVVGSPLSVVGGMVSLGGKLIPVEELGAVPFSPGSFELRAAAREKLEQVANAVGDKRAELELEVRGTADPKLDGGAGDLRVLARRRAEQVRQVLVDVGFDESQVHLGDTVVASAADGADGEVVSRVELR